MNKLEWIEAFVAVAKAGSFTGAGRATGLSTALISKYVGQLEDHLGGRLFNRTTRAVSLTEMGQQYSDRAAALVDELRALDSEIINQSNELRGIFKIAAPRVYGSHVLMPKLAAFMQQHPGVDVDVMLDERQVDIIAEGFDLAIRVAPLIDSSLKMRRIGAMPFILCASPAYLDAHGKPNHPRDLARHKVILNSAIASEGKWRFTEKGLSFQIPVTPRARVNTARAAADLVHADLGIGLCLWTTVAEDINAGRLVRILEPYEAYHRDVAALYPASRHPSPKLRALLDHLTAKGPMAASTT